MTYKKNIIFLFLIFASGSKANHDLKFFAKNFAITYLVKTINNYRNSYFHAEENDKKNLSTSRVLSTLVFLINGYILLNDEKSNSIRGMINNTILTSIGIACGAIAPTFENQLYGVFEKWGLTRQRG